VVAGITRERLQREGQVRLNFSGQLPGADGPPEKADVMGSQEFFLPFAQGNFRTPSGKAELYSEAMKALGLDPVVKFTPPSQSRHGVDNATFPLELLARKADNFLNSTFSNPAFGSRDGRCGSSGNACLPMPERVVSSMGRR